MFKRIRKPVTTKEVLAVIYVFKTFRKVLTVTAVLGLMWSYVPWNYIKAQINVNPQVSMNMEEVLPSVEAEATVFNYPTTMDQDFDPSEVEIEHEVLEARTETTKTFRKKDGTYEVAVYNDVIHFQEDGEWKQVNNYLTDLGSEVENTHNKFKVKFPKKLDDNKKIKLKLDEYSIDWSVIDIDSSDIEYEDEKITPNNIKELVNINQSILYPGILPNVDIEYIITGSDVKENIILNQYKPDFSMTFEYKLKELEIVEDEDGNIVFINKSNEVVFLFNDLFMIDNNMKDSSDVKLSYVKTGNKTYELTVTPNDEWLKNASYPVKIDPSITINSSDSYLRDKYAYSSGANDIASILVVGSTTSNTYRSYLEIDLDLLNPDLNRKLTYAHLVLNTYGSSNYCDITCQVEVREVKDYVSFGNILNANDDNLDDTGDIDDVEDRVIDYRSVNSIDGSNQFYFWDITRNMQLWLDNNDTSRIIEMKNKVTTSGDYVLFDGTRFSSGVKPTIVIGYTESTGLKEYWTYSNQDLGIGGKGYVSDYTGKLTLLRNDFALSTERQSLSLTMAYNIDNRLESIGYGLGWQTNYNITVDYDNDASAYYSVDATGNKVHYYPQKDEFKQPFCDTRIEDFTPVTHECYIAEDGSGNIYVRASVYGNFDHQYILTTDQIMYNFGSDAFLDTIKDTKKNHSIIISRDSSNKEHIKIVKDQVGNKLDFTYVSDRLTSITLSLKQPDLSFNIVEEVVYEYTYKSALLDYALYKVKYYKNYDANETLELDETANYYYDTDARLEHVIIVGNEQVDYLYDSADRIINIKSSISGDLFGEIEYDYGYRKTVITNHNDEFAIYKFDSFGHTVNTLDSSGNAQFFSYLNLFKYNKQDDNGIDGSIADIIFLNGSPNYNNNHQLVSNSEPVKTIMNPVYNHGFESPYTLTAGTRWQLYENGVFEDGSNLSLDVVTDDISLIGSQSARISNTLLTGSVELRQNVELKENFYMLVAYGRNDSDGNDAYLEVRVDGIINPFVSADLPNDGEWHEMKVYFDTDTDYDDVTISLVNDNYGAVYFDSVQIVEGFKDTRLNQLDDASFELSTPTQSGWSNISNPNVQLFDHSSTTTELEESILGKYSIEIEGEAGTLISTSNFIEGFLDFGEANGSLLVGGWAKSEGTPTSMQYFNGMTVADIDRVFRINIKVYGAGMILLNEHFVDFDPSIEGWQYLVEEVPLDVDVQFLSIALEFQGEGKVYFDSLQVYYEQMNTDYTFDEYGHVTSVSDPSGDVATFIYENKFDSRPTKYSLASGEVEFSIADEKSLIDNMIINDINSKPNRNTYGQVTQTTVGESAGENISSSTSYLSAAFNQYIDTTTNEFNKTTTYYHDTVTGLLEAIENSKGEDLYYDYDNEGKLVKVISLSDYNSASSNIHGSVEYEYDNDDRLKTIVIERDANDDPLYYYELFYNLQNQIQEVKVNSQSLMSYTYEMDGTYYTNKLSTQTYGNGDSIKLEYDDENMLEEIWFKDDGGSFVLKFSYEYDQSGNLTVFNSFDNGTLVDSEYYTYDSAGRLTQVIDNKGNMVNYSFDKQGNVKELYFNINENEATTNYFYNHCIEYSGEECISESNLYEKTEYSTQDNEDVVKEYHYEDSALYRLDYINLITGTTSLFKQDFIFSGDTTRISQITYNLKNDSTIDYKYKYNYDNLGNISSSYYYEEATLKSDERYEYDELNQLIVEDVRDYTVTSNVLTETNYTRYFYYDDQGNILDSKTFLYGQNEYLYVSNITPSLSNYGYETADVYHSNGSHYTVPVQLNINDTFNVDTDMDFKYVEINSGTDITNYVTNQLCTSNVNTSIENKYYVQCEISDDYNDFGFFFTIVVIVGNPVTGPVTPQEHLHFSYDSGWQDQMTNYGTIDYVNGVAQTEVNIQSYTYDSQGNPIGITEFYYDSEIYDNATLEYDGRQLVGITITDSIKTTVVISYTYNDQGYRTSKTIDDGTIQVIEYTLIGDKVIYETDGSYGIIYTHDYDGKIISFNYDSNIQDSVVGVEYFYIRNQQGDITKILDEVGNVEVEYKYDAWGKLLGIDGPLKDTIGKLNPYRYRGYRYESELNLYYLNSRFYNPVVGRFINADGLLGSQGNILGHNMYAYAGNNPVMNIDPSGEAWWHWAVAAVVVVALAVATVATCGGALAAYGAIIMAANGVAMTGISSTAVVLAFATVGGGAALTTAAVLAVTSSSSDDPLKDFEEYGATALYMTIGGAITGAVIGAISYSSQIKTLGTSNCFVAGTVIKTLEGDVPIESVSLGDFVYSFNLSSEEIELRQVKKLFVSKTSTIVVINVNGETIETTPDHPFYVNDKGWITAGEIQKGDILITMNENSLIVEEIETIFLDNPINVYNFEVEDNHNYFVSKTGVLVHNECGPKSADKFDDKIIGQGNAHDFKSSEFKTKASRYDIYVSKPDGMIWLNTKKQYRNDWINMMTSVEELIEMYK